MDIKGFLISFGLLIVAMTVHEFAHGWIAYKLGDSTAKYSGRLTLNPLAHIDLIGTIILPLFLFITTRGQFVFGAAKAVPINYWALKNPKRDIIWIGLGGPMANFALAFLASVLWKILPLPLVMTDLLLYFIYINVILGVFNLVPIPPLDGSRILAGILPERLAYQYAKLESFGFVVVLLLVSIGLFDYIVWPVVSLILGLLGVSR